MSTKRAFQSLEIGKFHVVKKRGARKITLRIDKDGIPSVSVPTYIPYKAGVAFLHKNVDWVKQHTPKAEPIVIGRRYELYDGTVVTLDSADTKNSTRKARTGNIEIRLVDESDDSKKYFSRTINKHLALDTERVISARLQEASANMGVSASEVRYRATTSRWGSCNSKGVLTFSVFLAQLPNELIDYVITHELAHLLHMNHSQEFWALVASFDPDYKEHRKDLKSEQLRAHIKMLPV